MCLNVVYNTRTKGSSGYLHAECTGNLFDVTMKFRPWPAVYVLSPKALCLIDSSVASLDPIMRAMKFMKVLVIAGFPLLVLAAGNQQSEVPGSTKERVTQKHDITNWCEELHTFR